MLKQPTKYMAQITVRYSDDTGQTIEKTVNLSHEQSYQDFMKLMSDAYEVMRFTFGPGEFDKLEKAAQEPKEVVEPAVEETEKTDD